MRLLRFAAGIGPSSDLRPKPQPRPSASQINDRPRHVRVPALVHADGVAVSQPEQLSDAVRVQKVLYIDLAAHSLRLLS